MLSETAPGGAAFFGGFTWSSGEEWMRSRVVISGEKSALGSEMMTNRRSVSKTSWSPVRKGLGATSMDWATAMERGYASRKNARSAFQARKGQVSLLLLANRGLYEAREVLGEV